MGGLAFLSLSRNQIGDAGMIEFSRSIASGSLGALLSLSLSLNNIGNVGMSAFSDALGNGSLPALELVVVQTGHENHPALVAACKPREITIV